jgi:hypothetical protein
VRRIGRAVDAYHERLAAAVEDQHHSSAFLSAYQHRRTKNCFGIYDFAMHTLAKVDVWSKKKTTVPERFPCTEVETAIGSGGVSLTRRPACGLLACCDPHPHLDVLDRVGLSRPCAPTCFQVM